MGDNCTDDNNFPSAATFLQDIALGEQIMLGICCACVVICWILFADTNHFVWTRHAELRRITRSTAWLLGLSPTLAGIALLSMFVPRMFILRDVLAFITISIGLEKFVRLVRAYYRTFEKVRETVIAEQKISFNVPPCMCCCVCIKPIDITRPNIDKVRWTVLQYPIFTVIGSLVVTVTWLNGSYEPGKWAADNPYSYTQATRIITTIIAFHGLNILVKPPMRYMRCFLLGPKFITARLCIVFFGLQGLIFDQLIANTDLFDLREGINKAAMGNFYENMVFVLEMTILTFINRYTYRRVHREDDGEQASADVEASAQEEETNRNVELELEEGFSEALDDGEKYIEKNLGENGHVNKAMVDISDETVGNGNEKVIIYSL